MHPKRLIYILGAGRSGTTILDIILGNADGAISLGELNRYFKRGGIPPKRNSESTVTEFWRKFDLHLNRENPEPYDNELCQQLLIKNEYHTAFFKSLGNRTSRKYNRLIVGFYSVLSRLCDQEILIESSKYPLRALNISRILKESSFDFGFIYLKKDPIQVIRSFGRKGVEQPGKGFWIANSYYFLVNVLCGLVAWRLKGGGYPVCTITYEQLSKQPVDTLKKISRELDLETALLQDRISKGIPLQTGLIFDGNRIRLEESILFKRNEGAELRLSPKDYVTRAFNYLIYRG